MSTDLVLEQTEQIEHKCVCLPHSLFSRRLQCVFQPVDIFNVYKRDGSNKTLPVLFPKLGLLDESQGVLRALSGRA